MVSRSPAKMILINMDVRSFHFVLFNFYTPKQQCNFMIRGKCAQGINIAFICKKIEVARDVQNSKSGNMKSSGQTDLNIKKKGRDLTQSY